MKIMNVNDLSRDQKVELKQTMLENVLGRQPSWGDLADADDIVSDEQLNDEYGGTKFCDDDFFCSCS